MQSQYDSPDTYKTRDRVTCHDVWWGARTLAARRTRRATIATLAPPMLPVPGTVRARPGAGRRVRGDGGGGIRGCSASSIGARRGDVGQAPRRGPHREGWSAVSAPIRDSRWGKSYRGGDDSVTGWTDRASTAGYHNEGLLGKTDGHGGGWERLDSALDRRIGFGPDQKMTQLTASSPVREAQQRKEPAPARSSRASTSRPWHVAIGQYGYKKLRAALEPLGTHRKNCDGHVTDMFALALAVARSVDPPSGYGALPNASHQYYHRHQLAAFFHNGVNTSRRGSGARATRTR